MELLSSLNSMNSTGLLDQMLIVFEPEFYQKFSPPGKNYVLANFSNHQSIIEIIKNWSAQEKINFSGVLSVDDDEQFQLSKAIAKTFQIPYYSNKTLEYSSNKFIMKNRFDSAKVKHAKYILTNNLTKDKLSQIKTDIAYPNVLKITNGNGSEYIYVNTSEKELLKHFTELKEELKNITNNCWFRKQEHTINGNIIKINPKKDFLIEQFLKGEEYSCDFAINDNKITILRIVKKYKHDYFGYFNAYYLLNTKTLEDLNINYEDLKETCKRISEGFKIKKGVCMVDFIFNGSIYVIESSIRPGLSLFVPLMEQVYGYTSMSMLAKLFLEQEIISSLPESEGLAICIYAKTAGVIKKFNTSDLSKLKNEAEIIKVHKYEDVGASIKDYNNDHHDLLMGYVLIKDPKQDIKGLIAKINQHIKIEMVEQN